MSIIQRLRRIFKTEGQEFIYVLYRELLNREPDPEGFQEHVKFLSHGASKISVMRAILLSNECHHLLASQRPPTYGTSPTLIDKLRQTLQKEGREFVVELYRELLNREPDPDGLEDTHESSHIRIFQNFHHEGNIVVERGTRPSQFLFYA